MSDISNIYSKIGANYQQYNFSKTSKSASNSASKNSTTKASKTDKPDENAVTKSNISGKVIGDAKLSDKAASYYEELKAKYSDMDFILVSKDQKEYAKSHASSFASSKKMIVLIGEDEIEKMANDESFRAKYEGIIEKAADSFAAFSSSLASSGASVKNFGMQVNDDGTVSYFAVLEKSSKLQKERIEKKALEKKTEEKKESKKEHDKKVSERLEKIKEASKSEKENKLIDKKKTESLTFESDSLEDLLRQIQDYSQTRKSENILSDSELSYGQNIDFSI